MRPFLTLRFGLPLMIGIVGMVVLFARFHQNAVQRAERNAEVLREEAGSEGARLAGIMQHLVRRGLQTAGDLEVSYASNSPDLTLGLVCDRDDMVLHATQFQWRGVHLNKTPLAATASLVKQAKESMAGLIGEDASGDVLWSVYPFLDADGRSRAAVILAYDAAGVRKKSDFSASTESIAEGLHLWAGCLLIWLLLDWTVGRRVARIAEYGRTVKMGGSPVLPVSGADEIAQVGLAFHDTVQALRVTEQQLVAVSENERRQLGMELHDDVLQRVTAAQMKAGVLAASLRKQDSPQSALALQVADELQKSVDLARGCIRGLAPLAIHHRGLDIALKDLAIHLQASFGVGVSLDCEPGVADGLSEEQSLGLFRIAQELATNALKHARPSYVSIRLSRPGEVLRLDVQNDGRSFPEDQKYGSAGSGLHMVRQRLRMLHGALIFMDTEDSSGTHIRCDLPRASPGVSPDVQSQS